MCGGGESNLGGGGGGENVDVVVEVLGEEAYDAAVADPLGISDQPVATNDTADEPFALQSFPTLSSPTYPKTSSTKFQTSSSNNSPSPVVSFPPLPSPRPTTNHSRYRFAASELVFLSSERMTNSSPFCVSRSTALSLPRLAVPVGRRCRVGCEDVSNCTTRTKAPFQRER